jgi:WD40 repeat protein
VAIGPNSRTIASAAWDGTVRVWDADTGRELAEPKHPDPIVVPVVLSADGKSAASVVRDRRVHIWDLATATLSRSLIMDPKHIFQVDGRAAFSPRGDLLAVTGGADGRVGLYHPASGELTGELVGHRVDVTDVTFSPDGSRLASADRAGTLRLWDAASLAPVATFVGTMALSIGLRSAPMAAP